MSKKPDKNTPITDKEQLKLVQKAQKGDKKALQAVLAMCEKEVQFIVKTLKPKPSEIIYDDLVQEGRLAVYRALKKYDPHSNVRFTYYAMYWIRALANRYHRINRSIVKQSDLWPKGDLSLDAPIKVDDDDGDEPTLYNLEFDEVETRTPETEIEAKYTRAQVQHHMTKAIAAVVRGSYKGLAKDIVWNRILAEKSKTLEEIGNAHGRSRENTRKIEGRLLQYFKDTYND